MMPVQSSCTPPRKYMGTTVDVQPGTAESVNSRTQSAHAATKKLPNEISKPNPVMARNGAAENEVIPCQANASIFFNGYFDSPANLSALS